MSTNYYATLNNCECCKRADTVHLGKRSGGWKFNFQGSDTVRDFDAWCALVRSASHIEDEYRQALTADEMIALARDWQKGKAHSRLYTSPNNWRDANGYEFTDYDFS